MHSSSRTTQTGLNGVTNAASEVSGRITLSNAKGCSLTIDLSYKSADTSNNQNTGINFLWRNNSGTVEMVGVKPDDGDINISLGKTKMLMKENTVETIVPLASLEPQEVLLYPPPLELIKRRSIIS